jgi:adenylate kinase family enzyme
VKKMIVIGSGGSGKSTFAQELGERSARDVREFLVNAELNHAS